MTIVDEIITVIAVQRPHASSQKKHKHTIYIMSFVLLSYAGLPCHIGDFLAGNKVHSLPHLLAPSPENRAIISSLFETHLLAIQNKCGKVCLREQFSRQVHSKIQSTARFASLTILILGEYVRCGQHWPIQFIAALMASKTQLHANNPVPYRCWRARWVFALIANFWLCHDECRKTTSSTHCLCVLTCVHGK